LRVTTLPAPIIASSPIVTPGRMIEPPPIQTLRPIETGPTFDRVARVIGRVDLDSGSDLRARTYLDSDDVENNAVEVYKSVFAEMDIVAIVAIKRRPDHGSLINGPQLLAQKDVPRAHGRGGGRVVPDHPRMCRLLVCLKLRVTGRV
jgi:hypothetical protein